MIEPSKINALRFKESELHSQPVNSSEEAFSDFASSASTSDIFVFTSKLIKALNSFKQDLKDIKTAIDRIVKPAPHPLSGAWLDGQDVMMLLHISKRNLQSLRDSKTLPYSRINGKFYYKADDIKDLLEKNYSLNYCRDNVKPFKS